MFGSQFKEAITNSATFPEDDPKYFDILMSWVYHGQLPRLLITLQEGLYSFDWSPIYLYALADKFGVYEVMDRGIDQITKFLNTSGHLPNASSYGKVYSLTPEGSPLRRLYSQLIVYGLMKHSRLLSIDGGCEGLAESYPDLARDVVSVLLAANGSFENPCSNSQTCRFHIRKLSGPDTSYFCVMGPGKLLFHELQDDTDFVIIC